MWGFLAKLGGSILAGLGIESIYSSYTEAKADAVEQAAADKRKKFGKLLLIGAVAVVAYGMFKKMK